jgi:1-acyl-sn-glycerol-3-phosphate acyltransferase
MLRSHLNRLLLVAALLLALPGIAIAERLRRGAGRRLAVTAIRRVAHACGIRIETAGGESVESGTSVVLVPNHTSPMDIAAMLVARPDARFVAAAELFRIPLLGAAMRALGTVPIARHDPASSHGRVDELSRPEANRSLVMFPEGGIAATAEVERFKTGAFVVAINSGVAVIPVAITGSASVLPPKGRLRLRPGTVRVELLDPLSTAGLDLDDRADLARRARDRVVDGIRRAA